MSCLFLLSSCGTLDEQDIVKWAEGKVSEVESGFLAGELLIRSPDYETARIYNFEERYLAPDRLRVDLSDDDSDHGQIFLAQDDSIDIFHVGIKEHYQVSDSKLEHKLTFPFYNLINHIINDEVTIQTSEDDDGHLFVLDYRDSEKGVEYKEVMLDQDLRPEKVNIFRKEDGPPIMEVSYHDVEWDSSRVEETDFNERLLEMVFESDYTSLCELESQETLEDAQQMVEFSIKRPSRHEYSLNSIHACEVSEWVSLNSTGPDDNEYVLVQYRSEEDWITEYDEDKDYQPLSSEHENKYFLRDDEHGIVTWEEDVEEDVVKNILISKPQRNSLIDFVDSLEE